jgi:hypothetical protein
MVLVGFYFIFLRPPLLPEDLRFMAVSREQLQAVAPRLVLWLRWVFTVLGGNMAGIGMLLVHLAFGAFAERKRHALAAAAGAGTVSIGLMSVVNVFINSDFKLALLGLTTLWAAALACAFPRSGSNAR